MKNLKAMKTTCHDIMFNNGQGDLTLMHIMLVIWMIRDL